MIINTTQVEMVLNNKAIPAYSLEAENRKKNIYTDPKHKQGLFKSAKKATKKAQHLLD